MGYEHAQYRFVCREESLRILLVSQSEDPLRTEPKKFREIADHIPTLLYQLLCAGQAALPGRLHTAELQDYARHQLAFVQVPIVSHRQEAWVRDRNRKRSEKGYDAPIIAKCALPSRRNDEEIVQREDAFFPR